MSAPEGCSPVLMRTGLGNKEGGSVPQLYFDAFCTEKQSPSTVRAKQWRKLF